MMTEHWYSLSLSKEVEDNKELRTIQREIRKVFKVSDFFYPVYFGKDDFKRFKKVLFDNYLFFKTIDKNIELIFSLEKNIYVENIVSVFDNNNNRVPAQIPQKEIDMMKDQLEMEKNKCEVNVGDCVEVMAGMFNGLSGIVQSIKEETAIIKITLKTKDIKIEVEKICLHKKQ